MESAQASFAPASDRALPCPTCEYDLRAIASERCPECGTPINWDLLTNSQIPWAHRREGEAFTAYWRTVWLSMAKPERFAFAVGGDLKRDAESARRFRLITVLLASIPSMIAAVIAANRIGAELFYRKMAIAATAPDELNYHGTWNDLALPWIAGIAIGPMVPILVLLLTWQLSRSSWRWAMRQKLPPQQLQQAIIGFDYAFAPMTLCGIPLIAIAVIAGTKVESLVVAGLGWIVLCILLTMHREMQVRRRVASSAGSRRFLAERGVPLRWLAKLLLVGFSVPWIIGFLRIVLDSFRR